MGISVVDVVSFTDSTLQHREWEISIPFSRLYRDLQQSLGSPAQQGTATYAWRGIGWAGIYQWELSVDGNTNTVHFDQGLTDRGNRLETAFLVAGILGLALATLLQYGPDWIVSIPGYLVPSLGEASPYGSLASLIAASGLLWLVGLFYRGPRQPIAERGLRRRFVTYCFPYFYFTGLGTLTIGALLGALLNYMAVGAFVALFVYVVYHYAAGAFPSMDSDNGFDAGEPAFGGGSPFLIVFAVASTPVLVIATIASVSGLLPGRLYRTSAIWFWIGYALVPIALTGVYCLFAHRAARLLGVLPPSSNRSVLGRGIVVLGFLFVNFLTILFVGAVSIVFVTTPFPWLNHVSLGVDPVGIGVLVGASGGAFAGGIGLRWLRRHVIRPSGRPGTGAAAAVATIGAYGLFFALFVAIAWTLVTGISLAFGNAAIHDPSPRTVRTGWEGTLLYQRWIGVVSGTAVAPGVVGVLNAITYLPVTLLGLAWSHRVVRTVDRRLRIYDAPEYLDPTDRPVPDGTILPVFEDGTGPAAQYTLLGPSAIILNRSVLDAVEDDEQLNAIIAHEAYHIDSLDGVVGVLASVVSVLFAGRNVLLSVYDLHRSELEADLYAADEVSAEAFKRGYLAVWKQASVSSGLVGPQLGLPSSAFERSSDLEFNLGSVGSYVCNLVFAPYHVLFGGVLYDQAHAHPSRRNVLVTLPERAVDYVNRASMKNIELPVKTTITVPIPRYQVESYLASSGADPDWAGVIVDRLLDRGKLIETDRGLLVPAEER